MACSLNGLMLSSKGMFISVMSAHLSSESVSHWCSLSAVNPTFLYCFGSDMKSPPSVFEVQRAVIMSVRASQSHLSGSSLLRSAPRCLPNTHRGIRPNRILSTITKAFHCPISLFEFVQIVNKQKHLSLWFGDNVSDACAWQGEPLWVTAWAPLDVHACIWCDC